MIRSLLFIVLFFLTVAISWGQKQQYSAEEAAIKEVIESESRYFWARDMVNWKKQWVHEPYVEWTAATRDGVRQYKGWKMWLKQVKTLFEDDPEPSQYDGLVKKFNYRFRIYGDGAWVSFIQDDKGTQTLETRIMEKHNGTWKVALVSLVYNVNEDAGNDQSSSNE